MEVIITEIEANKLIKLRCVNGPQYYLLVVNSIAFRRGAGFRCFNP